MARERMVTRTIKVSEVEVLCMDTVTCDVTVKTFELTGDILDNEKTLKALRKDHETDEFKLVAIREVNIREDIYGMREIEFLKVAQKLDPVTRKMVDIDNE